jgi:DNA-binding CsgD family transcriptional regulator
MPKKKKKMMKKAVKKVPATTKAMRQARREQMAELRRKGETLKGIGDQFGITREAVRQHLVRYNQDAKSPVTTIRNFRKPNPRVIQRRTQIAEARRSGLSFQEIAAKFHVSTAVVRQDILVYNLTAKHPIPRFTAKEPKISMQARREVIKLRKSGAVCREIAEKYGVSISLVYKICQDANASKPKKS